jgi:cytidylate kinase
MTDSAGVPVIAVDGPGGTGKGTVSARLATSRGWHYLDSGALYRIVALEAARRGLDETRPAEVARLAESLTVTFARDDGGYRPLVDGVARGDELRTEACGTMASRLAALPEVRGALLDLQRAARRPPGLVADGRDMGTTVFPDAAVKIYLVARPEVRARRRYKQLKEKGFDGTLRQLEAELIERDRRDASRAASPARAAADAVVIDTSDLTVDEVVGAVEAVISAKPGTSGN